MRLCLETRLTLVQACVEAIHELSEDDRGGIARVASARQKTVESRVLRLIIRIGSKLHRMRSEDLREVSGDLAVVRRTHLDCRQRLQVGNRLRLHRSYERRMGIRRIECDEPVERFVQHTAERITVSRS